MTASSAPKTTPAEIKFRVDPGEKAQADQIAASVGLDTNTAMKVMFKRFIAERGFPFDMKAPAHVHGPLDAAGTAFGVSVGRLAQISAAGFARAAEAHAKSGQGQSQPTSASRRSARRR
jgi:addiction module RelB/DinJ family antitoxin